MFYICHSTAIPWHLMIRNCKTLMFFIRHAIIFQVIFSPAMVIRSRQVEGDEDILVQQFIAGNGSNMYVLYRNFNTSNSSCIMASRIALDESTHEAEYRTRWYNLTAALPRQIVSLYKTSEQTLTATQCYGSYGNSTNNYTIMYTDGSCAVVIVHHQIEAAVGCKNACEMWAREGSVDAWNPQCDLVYREECGNRNITMYDEKYCQEILNYFVNTTTKDKPSSEC
ncbi:uncharacterized protein LOC119386764 isoform X2 [Rhipicephalus sanguineus]|uniref:uncharacterized protein LOC119386764 isoform X2 n=1 Tax=Rhipicephalus sanguineus TaxID=34632 RepID=UPI0020C41997|nr:uncharacterized protein LOC119386764 isoform X2 [Rhipicephalus sanguineus]